MTTHNEFWQEYAEEEREVKEIMEFADMAKKTIRYLYIVKKIELEERIQSHISMIRVRIHRIRYGSTCN
jgi:hypothetical protein